MSRELKKAFLPVALSPLSLYSNWTTASSIKDGDEHL